MKPTRPLALAWVDQSPFYQAGLAGYSDTAMRLVARRHGCPYCVTEAMLDQFLLAGGKGLRAAELNEADHPIAGQLMGSHPADIAAGAKVLVQLGYDVIDVNLACPVKKIKKKARGGHLLSQPADAIAILDAVKQAVGDDRPISVKLRRAYDDSAASQDAFHRIFQALIALDYDAVTVHSRTVEQKYLGPGHRPFLGELVQQYKADHPNLLIGASGDIWQAQDIFDTIGQTHVDMVSVARGCIGNPWIFTQARAIQGQVPAQPPTIFEQRQVLLEHFELSVAQHGQSLAGRMMRKFGIRFARHHRDHDTIKQRFIAVNNLDDWHAVLADFYAIDGPGVATLSALPTEAIASCDSPACD